MKLHNEEIAISAILFTATTINCMLALSLVIFLGYNSLFTYIWSLLALFCMENIIWHKELKAMNKTLDYHQEMRKLDSELPF